MMRKVYVTWRAPDAVLETLRDRFEVRVWDSELSPPRDVLLEQVRDVDGLLCLLHSRIDEELLQAAPQLKVVADCSVGYDNVDVAACRAHGVMVTHTPDVLTDTVADTAFALVLAAGRRVVEGDRYVREGMWKNWTFSLFAGADVHHSTLGLLGPGRIAQAVARRALGFDMEVICCGRRRPTGSDPIPGARWVEFDELFRQSDFLSVHVPLTAETRGLVGRRELSLMKRTAFLINTARGPVVDQAALLEALQQGTIAGAGLDVFEQEPLDPRDPLASLSNVVLLPHVGSASERTRFGMADLAARNLAAVLDGQPPLTPIPELRTEN